jgi:hypothetical protein
MKEPTMGGSTRPPTAALAILAAMALAAGCDGGGDANTDAVTESEQTPFSVTEAEQTPEQEGETLTGEFASLEANTDRDISGQATLTRGDDGTTLSVQVSGLEANATHGSHLHLGSCADRGPHYQDDPDGAEKPPNEMWPSSDPDDPTAGLQSDENGETRGEATAEWRARDTAQAVFIHAPGDKTKIACADLS